MKLIYIFICIFVGCETNAIDSLFSPKVKNQIQLQVTVKNLINSNNWKELYNLFSEEYKKDVPLEFFLGTMETLELKISEFTILTSVGFDSAGYLICQAKVESTVDDKNRTHDVIFYSQQKEGWVIENFPFLNHSYINFGSRPKSIDYGIRE